MTRDGTVGRSDATEPNLTVHGDIDPVRMALANKTARIAWAVMNRHENYQRVAAAA